MSESSSGKGDRETGSSWCSLATRMVGTRGLAFTVGSGVTPLLHSCNFDRENVPGLKLYKESGRDMVESWEREISGSNCFCVIRAALLLDDIITTRNQARTHVERPGATLT